AFHHIKSVDQFQTEIIYPLLIAIEKMSTGGVSFSAMDHFHPSDNYLFISNHRDIILDSAFLNLVLHRNGFRTTEIAIGDNLLIYDWIEKLVKINRSFIVKRNLGIREQLAASKELSEYIRYALNRKGESVWLAQREGRTKDGNDQTMPALLKMLNMSNEGSVLEGFIELNIVPMAISYEIEPCGISKVEELLNRKHNPDFAKTQQDDLKSMANGFMMPKGRVHFGFGNPVNFKLVELIQDKKPNEAIQEIVNYIDRRIYYNYKLWPNNYIAYDMLHEGQKYSIKYTRDDKTSFSDRMEKELAILKFNHSEAAEIYLKMYANPVINREKHFGK
ncbi:MAG: 1-acyl-sn-glycerol-3-phosphate acyltransferase, partial [Prolixibacteraceae bacterium]|nr:1-acyl-sn-glycerol-3-phosphate acyltransferase [Prolixibacteraceae bacterium]